MPSVPGTAEAALGGFSIARRLLVVALVVLGVASMVLVGVSEVSSRRAADAAFDRLLAASAFSIAGAVQAEGGRVTVELPYAALSMLGFSAEDRIFYDVRGPDGASVTGYADLGSDLPQATSATPRFDDRTYRGDPVRIVTVGRLVTVGDRPGWATVRVAETRDARSALATTLLRGALLPLGVLVALALLLVHLGVRRALAPLRALERDLHARRSNDLSPVSVPVPIEVRELVGAMNGFMQRLDHVIARLSALVADAAHQVRTPLASLRAQAEIALVETDPVRLRERLVRVHHNAVHASQLIGQILMDATIVHRLESREIEQVPLLQVVEDALQGLDGEAASRLRTSVAPELADVEIAGDRVALREMLKNLVENALAYAPAGIVEVAAELGPGGTARLSVADRGPGIPDAEKPKVLERFRRGQAAREGTGSGLGLSIVEAVARAHGGTLRLLDRPGGGLLAAVDLPVLPSQSLAQTPLHALASVVLGFCLLLSIPGTGARAEAVVTRFPSVAVEQGGPTLTIAGATDLQQFEPIIRDYQDAHRGVSVAYVQLDTGELYDSFVAGTLDPAPDLLISSAVDLQVKLANDGYARRFESEMTRLLPDWARWHSEVFGFTFEPAVIVVNPDLVPEEERPRSRLALAQLLEHNGHRFMGKVATYDIARSGVGHLLAAQDSQVSSLFWRLATALGSVGVRLHCCSGEMIDMVEAGKYAIAYNVLGSYAEARRAAGAKIAIVMPSDYTLVLTRGMLIPRSAKEPGLAGAFIDHVLSPRGQAVVGQAAGLGSVMAGPEGGVAAAARGPLQPIGVGPWLLAFLDQQRRTRFLETWLQIVNGT
jgi:two-component system, OmpR family, sensor histidine kinase TctE